MTKRNWRPWAGAALLVWAGVLQVRHGSLLKRFQSMLIAIQRGFKGAASRHVCDQNLQRVSAPFSGGLNSSQALQAIAGDSQQRPSQLAPLASQAPSTRRSACVCLQWDFMRLKKDPRFREKFPEHSEGEDGERQVTVRLKTGSTPEL